KNPITWGIMLGLVIILLPIVYLTYARAAALAVIFALGVGIAVRLRLVNLIMPVMYAVITVFLVYISTNHRYMNLRPNYQRTYMHRDFDDHIIATFRGEDMSSMERIYRWIASIRMSADEPIKGFG